ncbi:MAG TPA: DinB family protein [Thermomicrobiales bacterium]|nr:DinB family protein [Thermomicrobiales bacterium]
MATREEIIEAIRQGIEVAERTFSSLSDEQLATEVYEGGWTAKEILAHLAGRQGTYDMLINMASGGEMPEMPEGGFDVDGWNQRIVDERIDRSRDELLAEFRSVHEALIERVQSLDDSILQATVVTPRGEAIASDVLRGSGGLHSVAHSNDVAQALGL